MAWRARVGVGFSAVTVAAGRAYTLGNVDKADTATLWCLDAASGRPVWKREWPSPLKPTMYEGGPNASAVVEGNRLYAVIKPARLVCLEAATGESIWETDLAGQAKAELSDWGVVSSPVIAGDLLLLNYGSLGSAFDARTGRLKWITGPGQAGFNSPVVARMKGEPTAMMFGTNRFAAVNLKDGAVRWEVPFGEGYFCHSADPVVAGEVVYFGSADHGGQAIEFAEGAPRTLWKNRRMGNFMVGSVIRDGHLYGINNCDAKAAGAELKCVDLRSGEVKWAEKGFGWGSLIAARDLLLVLSDKGEVSVVRARPEKYELVTRFQGIGGKCWTPPSLAGGRLYLRNAAGEVVCLDAGPPKTL